MELTTVLNIQQLSEKRKRWVEVNRENGFEDGIKRLLTDLYPDNAHFIYELLQNAEDASASEVQFILNDDSVEFEHNGDRLFSIEDVDSITSIGVSTKKDDPTSIGKFGVGFKAVFAYTTTPKIESGEYHFRIHDLVVPDTDGLDKCALGEKKTRITFPFDNPQKPPDRAQIEIERHLRQLNESTLLFLSNIRKIEYLLPDSTLGFLERTEKDGKRIEISVQHPEDSTPISTFFLRFEKVVDVNDEDGKPKSCRISIAFSLEKTEGQDTEKSGKQGKRPSPAQWRINSLLPGQVSIYFPADKEKSNLRFHLDAPFASTVARDSVRDCQSNNELRDHLANLIAESMATIRDHELLTVAFLATLPNDKDNLSSFYKPILNSLISVFQNEELTPMKQGGHAAANGIFRGPAQLSNLISDDDLATILGEDYFPPMWVANPPQRNQREDNFLSMLNISEWTIENLVSALSADSKLIVKLLAEKSDEWHQQLYALLGDFLSSAPLSPSYESRNRKQKIAELRIIHISDGTYSVGSKCYFPSEGVEHDDLMPRVAKGVYTFGNSEEQKKKAKDFLEKIGVREVGEAEQVEAILKDRYSQEAVNRKAFNPRMEDINRFIELVEKDPTQERLYDNYFIFRLTDGKWAKPSQVYLDSPFYDTGLTAYFEAIGNKSQCWALSLDYNACGISYEKISDFSKKVGVITVLNIKTNNDYYSIDFTIDYLEAIIKLRSLPISKLIWKTMVFKEMEASCDQLNFLRKLDRADGRCRFSYVGDSSVIKILRQYEWIPQKNPKADQPAFVKPEDADSKLLPDGLSFDNGWKWLNAVKFGCSIQEREESESYEAQRKTDEYQRKEEAAKSLGFDSTEEAKEMVELKQKDPVGFKKWKESNEEKASFPIRTVVNLDRRQERLAEQLADATEKEYEKRDRSVRTTRGLVDPHLWLKEQYTNEADQMVCQICKKEMPFKKRDGEYYFEAVEALTKDHFPLENEAQFLALCPLCAAMYTELLKKDEAIMAEMRIALLNMDGLEVPLRLGDKETIQFVETHWQDMRTILRERS